MTLNFKTFIVLPTVTKLGLLIMADAMDTAFSEVRSFFLSEFGGFTSQTAVGTFRLESGAIQTEDVRIIFAFHSKQIDVRDFNQMVQWVAMITNQESILAGCNVAVLGSVSLISP